MTIHPEVLWAQRSSDTQEEKNVLYVTINLPDIQEATLKYELTATSISVQAKAGNSAKGIAENEYAFSLDFFSEVVPEQSKKHLTSRSFYLVLQKKEKNSEYWPRLTKEKVKTPFIKTDFSKWVDEDEQDGEAPAVDDDEMGMGGLGGLPGGMPGGMGGMPGGMGGMPGGMDFEKMMASMGGADGLEGAGPSGGEPDGGDSDSDDDGPPPLEDAEPVKA